MCVRFVLAVFLASVVVPRVGASADEQAAKTTSLMRREQAIAQLQKEDELQAQEELSMVAQIVSEFDADKDGKLSFTEVEAMDKAKSESGERNTSPEQLRADFKVVDANGDGLLNNTEVSNMDKLGEEAEEQGRNLATFFKETDADQDGRLSLEEISTAHLADADSKDTLKTQFDASDSNHDGFLEAAEFLAFSRVFDDTQDDTEDDGSKGAEDKDGELDVAEGEEGDAEGDEADGEEGEADGDAPEASEFLTDLDTDKDGKVSLAEILAREAANHAGTTGFSDAYKGHFEQADADKDSLLDLGEFSKLLENMEATDSQHEDAHDSTDHEEASVLETPGTLFTHLDADKNGQVSLAEVKSAAAGAPDLEAELAVVEQHFLSSDADASGSLDAHEMEAFHLYLQGASLLEDGREEGDDENEDEGDDENEAEGDYDETSGKDVGHDADEGENEKHTDDAEQKQ